MHQASGLPRIELLAFSCSWEGLKDTYLQAIRKILEVILLLHSIGRHSKHHSMVCQNADPVLLCPGPRARTLKSVPKLQLNNCM